MSRIAAISDYDGNDFAPALLGLQARPPAPMARWVLRAMLAFTAVALAWAMIGEVDIIASAPGRLVPTSYLQIVQPAEAGIVKEILVREGDRVQKDQILARMDTTLARADAKTNEQELAQRRLQLRRIDAELAGAPLLKTPSDADPVLHAQTVAQYHARRQAYRDALATERASLTKAREDLRAASEIEAKLRTTLPIYEKQEAAWDRLAKEGFAGKLMALDKTKERMEREQEMRAQQASIESARANIDQSSARLQAIESNYKQQLQNERVEAQATLAKLEQEERKLTHRQGLLELRAPDAGIVKDLATHTVGSVLQPGSVLMSLVPSNDPLQAEVWIGQDDAGFVKLDQKTKLKLATYPFQKYGMVEGSVRHMSPDAVDPNAQNNTSPKAPAQGGYRTLVAIEVRELTTPDGMRFALTPGMQLQAEIHLGTRTILEYLLSPVQKTVGEAGRER